MFQRTLLAKSVTKRGKYSIYVNVNEDWIEDVGVDRGEDDIVLERNGVSGDRSVRLTLYLDGSDTAYPEWTVDLCDLGTVVSWAIPADIRRAHGISDEFSYNAEYDPETQTVTYDLVAPKKSNDIVIA